jgi:DNA-directed RNA polymerase specialized sigma24 family protein
VSLTPKQRAQILDLYQVERVSIVRIAVMSGLSCSAVRTALQPTRRPEASEEKAAAMCPSSKGYIERGTS